MVPEPKLSDKRWKKEHEAEIFLKSLEESKKPSGKRIWVIDTPPPYPSGRFHIGSAVHYSQIDMIARFWRMMGRAVWFPLGIDRNGLPIESRVEKDHKIRAHKLDRQEFLKLCKQTLDKYEENLISVFRLMGMSLDWDQPYRTDSNEYRTLTQQTFIELWNRKLIYEDNRPNNWCPGCKTTIADAEIEYKTVNGPLVNIKFHINKDEYIEIATTRPELIGACQLIMVHPDDKRYKKLVGKEVTLPIYDRPVKIIAHQEANPEFGTGAMMVCSYGDQTDIKLFRELGLEPILLVSPEARMTDKAGRFAGMKMREARETIIEELRQLGLVNKIEQIEHKVPICWRSKDKIEFIAMPEWYLKQQDFTDDIAKIADKTKFHPKWSKQLLMDWNSAVNQDWPISRRRFYGTEVPVYYCQEHGAWVPKPGQYYQPWKQDKPCPICGKPSKGDTRVLDTWMDSSISALWVSRWANDQSWFNKSFPIKVRPQGKDIVRTWLYYSLLRTFQLTGKPAFEHAWISGHIVDEHGKKMSKSLGNIIWPETLVEKYGADALRFQGAAEAKLGSDIRLSEERIAGAAKFVQKLYNVSRFISMFELADQPDQLNPTDNWILSELAKTIKKSIAGYEELDFFVPANEIKNFVWETFAPHYLEMVKSRAYDGDAAAIWTLNTVLQAVLALLAPIMPFVTDYVYRRLYQESVHKQLMPEPSQETMHPGELIKNFNEEVWATKKGAGKSLRDSIKLEIPAELADYESDLKKMHNLSN
ncbi:MAG: valine--tRNA ligase [Candidatus Altiarchaeota archaeon]|nr:valine--tRNA ligase [Candidatus Altiarchaeota archaeon]